MWSKGPVVLGVPWQPSERLIRTGADLAAMTGVHLVCAFVDPASYLTEWEPANSRPGVSLDPAPDRESDFPASDILEKIRDILGPPGQDWSFRVLNGEVSNALTRLADSTDASMLIVGGQRPGSLAGIARLLEKSVSVSLIRSQTRPVMVVPYLGP
ncbi:universal stress protein [Micrococcaceae bacterium Sec7.4]